MSWPRDNFNDIFSSLVTVFIVIMAEDWNATMYLYVRAYGNGGSGGRPFATFYFITLFIVGNTIMMALFTALLLKNFKEDLAQVKKNIKKRELREAKSHLLDEESDEEGGENPCKACCKSYCTGKAIRQKYESFAERFIEVFGGKYALIQHQKKRSMKDPKRNASPISGNAIMPVVQSGTNVSPTYSIQKFDEESKELDIFTGDVKAEHSKASNKDGSVTPQSAYSPDKVDINSSPNLQRPPALLHYDTDQVAKVKSRQNTKTSVQRLRGRSLFLFNGDNCIRKVC